MNENYSLKYSKMYIARIPVILVLLMSVKITTGQPYKALANKEIVRALHTLFDLRPEDAKRSGKLFSSDIYCMLCEIERPIIREKPYNHENSKFVSTYLEDILSSEWLQRAKASDDVFMQETPDDPANRSDYIVFFTTHKDEIKGIGAQLGIYFKKENGNLKVSGFETIP